MILYLETNHEVKKLNRAIYIALLSIGMAQFLKIPIKKVKTGQWDWYTMFETGGMPSSHSAGVSSLATYIALSRGISSVDFGLSSIFGLIVMYDAQGVRRQAGELTLKVNELDEEIEKLVGQKDHHYHDEKQDRLKEMLGHQPKEVIGGALFGMITGIVGYLLSKK